VVCVCVWVCAVCVCVCGVCVGGCVWYVCVWCGVCVCVKNGKGILSNTTMSIKVYLMATLDNYMFRPLLSIFRLSSRELKILLYTE